MKISTINLVIIRWRHQNLFFNLQHRFLERIYKIKKSNISFWKSTLNRLKTGKQLIRII